MADYLVRVIAYQVARHFCLCSPKGAQTALLSDFGIFVIRFWNKEVKDKAFEKTISEVLNEQAKKKRPKPLKRCVLCHPNPMSID
uniref:Uncharacterized protein n=1 Tax=viral metagenome TaxID=1070528 RepID=A0A6M3J0K6_9ZZZZ